MQALHLRDECPSCFIWLSQPCYQGCAIEDDKKSGKAGLASQSAADRDAPDAHGNVPQVIMSITRDISNPIKLDTFALQVRVIIAERKFVRNLFFPWPSRRNDESQKTITQN